MGEIKYPLSLVVRAVDKATGSLKLIQDRVDRVTAPVKRLNNRFAALNEASGFPKVLEGFSAVGSAVQNVGKEFFALGAKMAAMAVGAGYALYRVTTSAIDSGDELAKTARRVGLNVDAFAQLRFAAEKAGISQDEFTTGMQMFAAKLGEAKAGGGSLLTFLQKVGPGLAVQIKNAKNTSDATDLMAKAFFRLKDPLRQAALAREAFGRSGFKFGEFLGKGPEALAALKARFAQLAGSQIEFAKRAEVAKEATIDMDAAFDGVRATVATALFPAITKLALGLSDFLAKHRTSLQAWAERTGAAISKWVDSGGLDRLAASLGKLADLVIRVAESKTAWIAFAGIHLAPLISAFVSLGTAIAAVDFGALAVFTVAAGPFLLAAGGIAAAGLSIYTNWDKLKFAFKDTFSSWSEAGTTFLNVLKAIGEAFLTIAKYSPPGLLVRGASALYDRVSGSGGGGLGTLLGDRPTLGAAAVAPPGGGAQSPTRILVDFTNMPKGTRVTQPDGSTRVDLGLGWSMVTP